jgi:hypothetical protein
MEPKLIIVRFDETRDWSEEIQSKCKVLWGYYLIDLTQHIYQCSMSPDVQGYFLYNRLDWKGKKCPFTEDEMSDMESLDGDSRFPTFQASTNWGEYKVVDCSDFDEGGHEGAWEEFVEGMVENYQCNPIEFEFCDNLITL